MLPRQLQSRNHTFSSPGSTDYIATHCPERAQERAQDSHGGQWCAIDTCEEGGITYQIVMRE